MLKSFQVMIEKNGRVTFMEPLLLEKSCRGIVTIIDEPTQDFEITHLSEAALSDWLNPEEDIAQ